MSTDIFRRICLVHAGAVGDFVLALRLVRLLKSTWPGATVQVLGRADTARVALGRAGIDGITSLEMPGLHTFFADDLELDARCAGYFRQFDLIIDMLGGRGGIFGRRIRQACQARVVSIETQPRPDHIGHISDQWIDDLLAADIGLTPHRPGPPRILFEPTERLEARARLQKLTPAVGQPIVLLHPGSGSPDKCWPTESFQGLAMTLPQTDVSPMFMVGPVELDRGGEDMIKALVEFAPVLRDLALPDAAALIAAANAYVGNDSGMTHVAAAVETPTVALFAPTDPTTWAPLGRHVRILQAPSAAEQPFAGLDVATVHRAVLACLDRPPRPA